MYSVYVTYMIHSNGRNGRYLSRSKKIVLQADSLLDACEKALNKVGSIEKILPSVSMCWRNV